MYYIKRILREVKDCWNNSDIVIEKRKACGMCSGGANC